MSNITRDSTATGYNLSTSGTSFTITIATSGINRLALLFFRGPGAITSISGAGTWNREFQYINSDGPYNEVWSCQLPAQIGSTVVTVNYSGPYRAAAFINTYYGADISRIPTIDVKTFNHNTPVNGGTYYNHTSTLTTVSAGSTIIQFIDMSAYDYYGYAVPTGYTQQNYGDFYLDASGKHTKLACNISNSDITSLGTVVTVVNPIQVSTAVPSFLLSVLGLDPTAPFAPSNPVVTDITKDSVNINPGDLSFNSCYINIEVTTSDDTSFVSPNKITINSAVLSQKNAILRLVPNTNYICRSTAVNVTGSLSSSTVSFTTLGSNPPPTSVSAVYTAHVGITISWVAPVGFTGSGYYLYRKNTYSKDKVKLISNESPLAYIPWGTTSFIDRRTSYPGLHTNENQYSYYLTTVYGGIEGQPSNTSTPVTFIG